MKSLITFINEKQNFLIKGHTKSQNNELVEKYYIVLCYDNNFDYIVNRTSRYWKYLDADPKGPESNPAAFIMDKEQIRKSKEYVDDILYIPSKYNFDKLQELEDDWFDEKIKVDDLQHV